MDWYRRKIADQERYVGDLHDGTRARAVLDEEDIRARIPGVRVDLSPWQDIGDDDQRAWLRS